MMRWTREVKAFGTEISTWWMGSKQHRVAFRHRLGHRLRPQVLNAWSELSTAWNWPVTRCDRDIDDGESPSGPCFRYSGHAFLDRGDEVARNGAAHHRVLEDLAGAARQRLHLDLDVGELAVAAASGA